MTFFEGLGTTFVDAYPAIPQVSYNEAGVPLAFVRHCGAWEGQALRIGKTGELLDEHRVRVEIAIDGCNYVQTNTTRLGTDRELTARYFGEFQEGKLVFPLTDEVYTLSGEKATRFSGIAWTITDNMIIYSGSRTVRGVPTHYNELITVVTDQYRVRTTQLYESKEYKLVTMIDEYRVS